MLRSWAENYIIAADNVDKINISVSDYYLVLNVGII